MAKKASSISPPAKPASAPIDAGERKARHAQAAFRQAERARGVVVLGDRQKGVADQGVAIEQFEADDHDRAGQHRQPELLIEIAAGDVEQPRKRLRLGAPFDRGELLDHQRQRQRREHVEMLVQALEHRPHGDDLGDDAEHRAAGQRKQKPAATGMPMRAMNSEPSTPPSIPSVPAVKLNTREAENITL